MPAGQNHSNFALNSRLSAPRYDTWCKIQVLTNVKISWFGLTSVFTLVQNRIFLWTAFEAYRQKNPAAKPGNLHKQAYFMAIGAREGFGVPIPQILAILGQHLKKTTT